VTDDIVTDESTTSQNFGPEPEQVARFIDHWAPSGGAERAIFGTLLERALDPVECHKLGAHYTPRAYVERLSCRQSSTRCAITTQTARETILRNRRLTKTMGQGCVL